MPLEGDSSAPLQPANRSRNPGDDRRPAIHMPRPNRLAASDALRLCVQGTVEYILAAAASKAAAGLAAYPTQVLRSRMQKRTGTATVVDVALLLWR